MKDEDNKPPAPPTSDGATSGGLTNAFNPEVELKTLYIQNEQMLIAVGKLTGDLKTYFDTETEKHEDTDRRIDSTTQLMTFGFIVLLMMMGAIIVDVSFNILGALKSKDSTPIVIYADTKDQ